jgi:hypothetical protein
MSKAAELAALIGSQSALSNRSLIINGSMQLDQRGNASATNLTGGGVFTTDRFFGQEVGAGLTVSAEQSTTVPSGTNFQYSTKHTVTAAASGTDHWTRLTTRLEGYDIARAGLNTSGNKLTLSFYVQSTRTGTHTAGLTTGYRAGSSYAQAGITLTYTINSANTWERKTIAFDSYDTGGSAAWNTDNNLGVEIAFTAGQGTTAHGSGSINSAFNTWEDFSSVTFVYPKSTSDNNNWGTSTSDRFYITGVQLEVGEQATPFEHRSFGDELARCQRYYFQYDGIIYGQDYGGVYTLGSVCNPVTMRAQPTYSAGSNPSSFTLTPSGKSLGWVIQTSANNISNGVTNLAGNAEL